MSRIFRSFTFFFVLISLFTIYMHYIGYDSKSIVLIHMNPILSEIKYTDFAKNVLSSGPVVNCRTLSGSISIYWYFANLVTFIIYGVIFDFIRLVIRKLIKKVVSK